MKKFSAFIILLLFSVNLTYAQKSKTNKSEKIFTKNWRVIKSKDNSSLSSVKPNKKINANRVDGKIFTKNWKVIESKNKSSLSSVKPNKKINANRVDGKILGERKMNSSDSHSRSKKQNKSTYSNSLNNSSLSNKSITSSGALTKARTTVRKPNKRATKKNKFFSTKNRE